MCSSLGALLRILRSDLQVVRDQHSDNLQAQLLAFIIGFCWVFL